MAYDTANLPFPRGKTWATENIGETLSSTSGSQWVGKTYTVVDEVHGTNFPVRLRVVRNSSGGDLTLATVDYHFMAYRATTSNDLYSHISGAAGTAGVAAAPIDDYYQEVEGGPTTIAENDLFYVVDEGPVDVQSGTGSPSIALNQPVATDASGTLGTVKAVAGQVKLGVTLEAVSVASTNYLIYALPPEGAVTDVSFTQAAAQADPTLDASDITDNSGGVDPADHTIAAVTTPTDIAITWTANDPSITPDHAITIADGSSVTNAELTEYCEELNSSVNELNDAVDALKNAVALIAAEYNSLKDDTEANEAAIEGLIDKLQSAGLMAT